MNSGFGIAALIVFFLSLGVPFVGNFITLIALLLVAVAAWQRNIIWPIAIVSASAVKLFFLSPSWMIAMSQDGGYVVWTLLFLAIPIGVLLFRRAGSDEAPAEAAPFWPAPSNEPTRATSAPAADDIADWDRIADKNDPDSLQEYLLRHPSGRFAELARMKLDRLGVQPLEPQPVSLPPTEQLPAPAAAAPQAMTPGPPAVPAENSSFSVIGDESEGLTLPDRAYEFDVDPPRRGPPAAILIALAVVIVGGAGFGGVFMWRQYQLERAERAAWESVAKTDSAALRRFLSGDPGDYRDDAQDALAQLEAQRSRDANAANTILALEGFLAEFPDGAHALAARGRLAELQEIQRRETQFGPGAVWSPQRDADLQCTAVGCLAQQIEATGAMPQAVAFTQRLNGEGYMSAFYELGRVDVAEVVLPRRANTNQVFIIVNGNPELVWVENESFALQMDRNSTFRTLRRLYPNAAAWPPHRFIGAEMTADGGQRIVFGLNITDGCRACAVIANGELVFDFDATGAYRGASLTSVTPPAP